MVSKPSADTLPQWAESDVTDPVSGQNNVIEPPPEKMLSGWARLEYPPRNWFNWLARYTYRWLAWFKQQEEQAVITDGAGVGLFPTDGALITLWAVDIVTPANYVYAMGFKASGATPVANLTILHSNVLGLGAGTVGGDQIISGGTAGNIITWGQTKIIP